MSCELETAKFLERKVFHCGHARMYSVPWIYCRFISTAETSLRRVAYFGYVKWILALHSAKKAAKMSKRHVGQFWTFQWAPWSLLESFLKRFGGARKLLGASGKAFGRLLELAGKLLGASGKAFGRLLELGNDFGWFWINFGSSFGASKPFPKRHFTSIFQRYAGIRFSIDFSLILKVFGENFGS